MSKFFKIFAVFGLILGFAAPAHAGLVLVIDEGNDELAVNEWFPTKRQCYKFAVNWLMTFSD